MIIHISSHSLFPLLEFRTYDIRFGSFKSKGLSFHGHDAVGASWDALASCWLGWGPGQRYYGNFCFCCPHVEDGRPSDLFDTMLYIWLTHDAFAGCTRNFQNVPNWMIFMFNTLWVKDCKREIASNCQTYLIIYVQIVIHTYKCFACLCIFRYTDLII